MEKKRMFEMCVSAYRPYRYGKLRTAGQVLSVQLLAYAMRRMGPTLMGRNGAFQIAADLFKLLTKEVFLIPRPTTALAPIFLTLLYCFQLLFAMNFV